MPASPEKPAAYMDIDAEMFHDALAVEFAAILNDDPIRSHRALAMLHEPLIYDQMVAEFGEPGTCVIERP